MGVGDEGYYMSVQLCQRNFNKIEGAAQNRGGLVGMRIEKFS